MSIITSNQELTNFLTLIKDEEILALDTEFLRINTYYPKPCLLQIANS